MEHLLNTREAADYLGISEKKLKELIRKKLIPAYKIGGAYLRFRKDQLSTTLSMLQEPANEILHLPKEIAESRSEKIKDFLYFNDFYIISIILIVSVIIIIFTS